MVVLANQPVERISIVKPAKPYPQFINVPVIDLSDPNCNIAIVKACEEYGFFKVINHGVPMELMAELEAEAMKFFSLPQTEKERSKAAATTGSSASPSGYGNKNIGPNGDVGWVEYLLFEINNKNNSNSIISSSSFLSSTLTDYLLAMRGLAVEVLQLMSKGLGLSDTDEFSKLLETDESDCIFRLNHYPPCPLMRELKNCSLTGFGEHTDPQALSILRSNESGGFQIALKDGSWVSVVPDKDSFFINAGDILQVLTNGRFKSVKHRVVTNGSKSRVSMIFFVGPPPSQVIKPVTELMREEEKSRYKEFTWAQYKKAAYRSRLADNRLAQFELQ